MNLNLTPDVLRRAADKLEEIDRLKAEIESVLRYVDVRSPEYKKPWMLSKKPHWSQTPAGRAKLAAIEHRRWGRARR